MSKEKKKIVLTLREKYEAFLEKFIKRSQEANSVPGYYSYTIGGAHWLLTRPRSVMEQKRIINLMRKHMLNEFDFDTEVELLKGICLNAQKNKQDVQLEQLEYEELELLKRNYIDWILLPLYLSGTKVVDGYMEEKLNQTGSSSK